MRKIASSPRKSKQNQKRQSKKCQPKTSIYRIGNWSEYNQALKQRGSLTVWFSEAVIEGWYYEGPTKQGAQFTYSDIAIKTALIFRSLFRLPFRQTEGFVQSLIQLMGLGLDTPDYSVLCRLPARRTALQAGRQEVLKVDLDVQNTSDGVHACLCDARLPARSAQAGRQVVVDSTGAKVFGEGEWKVRQHGWSKRRTWRKLHIAVDEATGEILAETLTTNGMDDASQVDPLLAQIQQEIERFGADGAYDKEKVYKALKHPPNQEVPIQPIIPPRRNAKIWQHGNCKHPPLPRDENLRKIRKKGRKGWKQECGYYRRSIAETGMSRYKRIFGLPVRCTLACAQRASRQTGPHLLAHTLERQQACLQRGAPRRQVEARTNCAILNRMASLGRPDSVKVELGA